MYCCRRVVWFGPYIRHPRGPRMIFKPREGLKHHTENHWATGPDSRKIYPLVVVRVAGDGQGCFIVGPGILTP